MKLKLDANNRKFIEIEIEIEDKNEVLKYFEKNTKQIKAIKKVAKKEGATMGEVEELNEKQFFENLKGDKKVIDSLIKFYDENGNFFDFINECDKELGKLKKKD